MFDFDLRLLIVLLILDRLTLWVREEGLVTPHTGLEEAHHHQHQQGAQADAGPHRVMAVGRAVPYLADHRLVLDLVLHFLGILHESAVYNIITCTG